jgi:hypothetical protein
MAAQIFSPRHICRRIRRPRRLSPAVGKRRARPQWFLEAIFSQGVRIKERAVKADFTPATQHDRGKADTARHVENQGHRAVPLPVMAQPMLHHPTATGATAFLPRASAMVPSCMTSRFVLCQKGLPLCRNAATAAEEGAAPTAAQARQRGCLSILTIRDIEGDAHE